MMADENERLIENNSDLNLTVAKATCTQVCIQWNNYHTRTGFCD